MLKLALLALLIAGSDADIAQHNARAIATARAAVSQMIGAAATPEEKALAEDDRQLVERAAALLSRRAAAGQAAGTSVAVEQEGVARQKPAGAGRQAQETDMSWNLQYRQLQAQMQHENRSYTAVSNILKSKHESVKNSIANLR